MRKSIYSSKTSLLVGGAILVAILATSLALSLSHLGHQPFFFTGSPSGRTPPTGDIYGRLPDFPIAVYQGLEHRGSDYVQFEDLLKDKPIVMNFWASNCPPCRSEMPHFQKVWEKYHEDVLIIGLDVGRFTPGFGDQEQSKKELQELHITYPAGTPADVEDMRGLRVKGLPSTLFITKDGLIRKTWIGLLNESKLVEFVDELLDVL